MCSGALDKVGYAYIAQAAHMAQNMGLHSERGVSRVIDNADPRVVKAMAVLAWGTFAYQSYVNDLFYVLSLTRSSYLHHDQLQRHQFSGPATFHSTTRYAFA